MKDENSALFVEVGIACNSALCLMQWHMYSRTLKMLNKR